jgi:copper(I)-binding protein
MRCSVLSVAALFCATSVAAQDIKIDGAYIPLSPPGVMTHAAYLDVENAGNEQRSLIGVSAEGYGMAHLHQSKEHDGVAAMSMVHQLDIAPGQTVSLKPGSFHIMLMHPKRTNVTGESVALTLHFANGEDISAQATIKPRNPGS